MELCESSLSPPLRQAKLPLPRGRTEESFKDQINPLWKLPPKKTRKKNISSNPHKEFRQEEKFKN